MNKPRVLVLCAGVGLAPTSRAASTGASHKALKAAEAALSNAAGIGFGLENGLRVGDGEKLPMTWALRGRTCHVVAVKKRWPVAV